VFTFCTANTFNRWAAEPRRTEGRCGLRSNSNPATVDRPCRNSMRRDISLSYTLQHNDKPRWHVHAKCDARQPKVSKEELLNGAVLLIIRVCQRLGVSSSPKSGLYRVCIYLRVGDSLVSEESPISYVRRSSAHPPFSRLVRFRCPVGAPLLLVLFKQVRAMFR